MRFRKMVIGITNAPLPSGDGKVVDGLTLGDLNEDPPLHRCSMRQHPQYPVLFSTTPSVWGPATPGRVH